MRSGVEAAEAALEALDTREGTLQHLPFQPVEVERTTLDEVCHLDVEGLVHALQVDESADDGRQVLRRVPVAPVLHDMGLEGVLERRTSSPMPLSSVSTSSWGLLNFCM